MIVVTAPTSKIGSQVAAALLDRGAPVRVIARDPARLPAALRERVEVVAGSHSEAGAVARAFDGADTVFWLVPADPRAASAEAAYVGFARPGVAAFRSHGVGRVVGISALGRGWTRPAGHVTATLMMDDLIAASGVAYRALACPSFMDNILRQVEPIRAQGTFFWPVPGDLAAPTCSTADIAAAAVRLLLDPSWSGVGSVPILGPEDLSFDAMAAIMSETLERPVRFREIAMDDFRAMLTGRGVSPGMAQAMVEMMTAKREGMDALVPRTPETSSPTTFRSWCRTVLRPAVLG